MSDPSPSTLDPSASTTSVEEDEQRGKKRTNNDVAPLPTEETQQANNQYERQQDDDVQMQDVAVASPNKVDDDATKMETLKQIIEKSLADLSNDRILTNWKQLESGRKEDRLGLVMAACKQFTNRGNFESELIGYFRLVIEDRKFLGTFIDNVYNECVRTRLIAASPLDSRTSTPTIDTTIIPAVAPVRGSFGETRSSSLEKYRAIAIKLKDDSSVTKVYDVLMKITSTEYPTSGGVDPPFVFLEGSSGTGKTQMAFNIQARIGDARKMCYFLFHPPSEGSQEVYSSFTEISKTFEQCYELDEPNYPQSPSCRELESKNLYVYGFIYQILCHGLHSARVEIEPKNGEDIRKLLFKKQIHQTRPIFFLDECANDVRKMRFVRNCFRSVGLGLVMLGTDSRASELPTSIGNGSRSGDMVDWCHVFGQYPAVDLSLIGLSNDTPEWLKALIVHSRPWFAQLAAKQFSKRPCDFDDLVNDVFSEVTTVKPIFRNSDGRLGQLRLFQNAHSVLTDWAKQSTPLVHSHFAQLNTEAKAFILTNIGTIRSVASEDNRLQSTKNIPALQDQKIWKPSSVFPQLQEDVLLHLVLMGGKSFSAFYDDDRGYSVPYAYFYMNLTTSADHRRHILDISNAVQPKNDGMFLESLLCATVCLTSHMNGIQGISLCEFLKTLVYNLQNKRIELDEVKISGLEKIKNFEYTVPFLSPPNQVWPSFVEIPDAKLATITRPKDTEQIDLQTDCGLYGEAKDHTGPIKGPTMTDILNRVPTDAKIELVYTRKMQKSYFRSKVPIFKDKFKGKTHLHKLNYYKINTSTLNPQLESIPGLPDDNNPPDGLVLFLEINESITQ